MSSWFLLLCLFLVLLKGGSCAKEITQLHADSINDLVEKNTETFVPSVEGKYRLSVQEYERNQDETIACIQLIRIYASINKDKKLIDSLKAECSDELSKDSVNIFDLDRFNYNDVIYSGGDDKFIFKLKENTCVLVTYERNRQVSTTFIKSWQEKNLEEDECKNKIKWMQRQPLKIIQLHDDLMHDDWGAKDIETFVPSIEGKYRISLQKYEKNQDETVLCIQMIRIYASMNKDKKLIDSLKAECSDELTKDFVLEFDWERFNYNDVIYSGGDDKFIFKLKENTCVLVTYERNHQVATRFIKRWQEIRLEDDECKMKTNWMQRDPLRIITLEKNFDGTWGRGQENLLLDSKTYKVLSVDYTREDPENKCLQLIEISEKAETGAQLLVAAQTQCTENKKELIRIYDDERFSFDDVIFSAGKNKFIFKMTDGTCLEVKYEKYVIENDAVNVNEHRKETKLSANECVRKITQASRPALRAIYFDTPKSAENFIPEIDGQYKLSVQYFERSENKINTCIQLVRLYLVAGSVESPTLIDTIATECIDYSLSPVTVSGKDRFVYDNMIYSLGGYKFIYYSREECIHVTYTRGTEMSSFEDRQEKILTKSQCDLTILDAEEPDDQLSQRSSYGDSQRRGGRWRGNRNS